MQDLIIIGGGSAGFSAAIKASDLGAKVTIINAGLRSLKFFIIFSTFS
jgi:mercuric reductase